MGKRNFEALQKRGMRVTPQRVHVWRVLVESGGHFTAEEIWERAGARLPGLELSTVYRTLEALGNAGLVSESRMPEGPRVFEAKDFEARASSHPHLVCEGCGGISHPKSEDVGRWMAEIFTEASNGFEVRSIHVAARGLCGKCAAKKKNGAMENTGKGIE